MHSKFLLLLPLFTVGLAAPTSTITVAAPAATGSAYVQNNCGYPVYLWSVDSTVSGPYTIASKGVYSEPMHYDNKTGGISLKITTTQDGLTSNAPQLNFAYALNTSEGNVYYDLSDVFGDPFKGSRVEVTGASGSTTCPSIEWPQGTPPAGSGTQACAIASDLTCSLC